MPEAQMAKIFSVSGCYDSVFWFCFIHTHAKHTKPEQATKTPSAIPNALPNKESTRTHLQARIHSKT